MKELDHMRPAIRSIAATMIGIAAMTVVLIQSASAATRGEVNGRIAFDSVRDGNRDIYVIPAPGSGQGSPDPGQAPTRITSDPAPDAKPSWSPQTPFVTLRPALLAFQRTAQTPSGLNTDIYIAPVGAGPTVRLTSDPAEDTAPAWAPDNLPGTPGEEDEDQPYPPIAFERSVAGVRDIFVIDPDGTSESNVTNTPGVDEANPDWAPGAVGWSEFAGGPHLAFDVGGPGGRQVSVVGLRYDAGSDRYVPTARRPVTVGQRPSSDPTWYAFTDGSADALTDRLAFTGPDRNGGLGQINIAVYPRTADSAGFIPTLPFERPERISTVTLTSDPADDGAPAWSPTGDRIAFESTRDGNYEIYALDPFADDEAGDVNLTRSIAPDRNPDWETPFPKTDETHPNQPQGRRSRPRPAPSDDPAPPPPPETPGPPGAVGVPSDCTVVGTPRADVLRGTSRRDVICGLGGADRLFGRAGPDVLRGGPGADQLVGGAGRDRLLGGPGDDRLAGGGGRDVLNGGAGRDLLIASGRQLDRLIGGPGRDTATVDRSGHRRTGVEIVR